MPVEAGSSSLGREAFRLGDWFIEPSLNRISNGDVTTQLELKVMDLLVFLATHARQVAPKMRLIDEVWETEFIADSALTRAVGEPRRALGETARKPRYLETITKGGYSLMAPLECLGEPPSIEPE